eukprot:8771-Heterococcus_DN1.PRE.1
MVPAAMTAAPSLCALSFSRQSFGAQRFCLAIVVPLLSLRSLLLSSTCLRFYASSDTNTSAQSSSSRCTAMGDAIDLKYLPIAIW